MYVLIRNYLNALFWYLSLPPNPQDNFTFSDQYETPEGVYDAIMDVQENHIVTHENDRAWRDAVVLNRPSLLALRSVSCHISMTCFYTVSVYAIRNFVLAFISRYQRSEDSYLHPYKIIRLTSKFIKFRVVKVAVFYHIPLVFLSLLWTDLTFLAYLLPHLSS